MTDRVPRSAPPRKRLRTKTHPDAVYSRHQTAFVEVASTRRPPTAAGSHDGTAARSASTAGASCVAMLKPSAAIPSSKCPASGTASLRQVARPLATSSGLGLANGRAALPSEQIQAGDTQAAQASVAKTNGQSARATEIADSLDMDTMVMSGHQSSTASSAPSAGPLPRSSDAVDSALKSVSGLDLDARLVPQGQASASCSGQASGLGLDVDFVPPGQVSAPCSGQESSYVSGSATGVSSAASTKQEVMKSGSSEGLAFLRLSSNCSQSTNIERLVYLDKIEVTIGRLPSNSVVLDSPRFPGMISRLHGRICRSTEKGKPDRWTLYDARSMNGILVNGQAVGQDGNRLQHGDVINFGRLVCPPQFEFIFEGPGVLAQPLAPVEVAFAEYTRRLAELEQELEAERERRTMESQTMAPARSALDISDIQSELLCCICRDWVVHASTLQCAHTFCWSCVDQWLRHKKFECPVCRQEITHEPVRSHAIDSIVQKTVGRSDAETKAEYDERVRAADEGLVKMEQLRQDLETAVGEASSSGKTYLQIESNWPRKEKDAFLTGAKDFTGNTRETYCRLRGLTVQWVHIADDSQLNQALHNLGLQAFVSSEEPDIRKRLLMFLRYG